MARYDRGYSAAVDVVVSSADLSNNAAVKTNYPCPWYQELPGKGMLSKFRSVCASLFWLLGSHLGRLGRIRGLIR